MDVIAGRDLDRYWKHKDGLLAFHRLFNEGGTTNERAIAIVGAAYIDGLLEHAIVNFMVDDEKEAKRLTGVDGSMGTFSSRVTAVYCLGLIPKTVRDDLRVVGKIRNRFAHQLEASFDIEPIPGWCRSLKWHEISMMRPAPADATPRDIFEVGVNQLICYLDGIVGMALLQRRKVVKTGEGHEPSK